MAVDLKKLLTFCVQSKGSDVYIYCDARPMIKVHGKFKSMTKEPLAEEQAKEIIYSMLTDAQIIEFERELELNTAITVDGIGRFRINVFCERGKPALVARLIESSIPSVIDLGLPKILEQLSMMDRGLVLVVGATGMGKSTSLASMIKHRAANRSGHIICIEDPIEFIHSHGKSLIGQREVGIDTKNYQNALKSAMRESPDAIMIGEVLDTETMNSAINFADTGHLCLATLHAVNANQAIDRIVNMYPVEHHARILHELSLNLNAVISMRLPIGVDGTRVPVVEVMLCTPRVRDLIREGELGALKEAIVDDIDEVESRSQTFDWALLKQVQQGRLSEEEALLWADSPNDLKLKMRFGSD